MFGTAKYTTDMSIDTSSRASMSTPSAVHSFRPALRVTSGMFDASRDWIEPFYCVRRTRHCVDHTQNQGEGQSVGRDAWLMASQHVLTGRQERREVVGLAPSRTAIPGCPFPWQTLRQA